MNEQSPFLETYARQRIHQQVSARDLRPRASRRTTFRRRNDARPW